MSDNRLPIFAATVPRLELPPPPSLSFPKPPPRPPLLGLSGLVLGLDPRLGLRAAASRPTGEGLRALGVSLGESNSRGTCESSVEARALDSRGNVEALVEALVAGPSTCATGSLMVRTKGEEVVR